MGRLHYLAIHQTKQPTRPQNGITSNIPSKIPLAALRSSAGSIKKSASLPVAASAEASEMSGFACGGARRSSGISAGLTEPDLPGRRRSRGVEAAATVVSTGTTGVGAPLRSMDFSSTGLSIYAFIHYSLDESRALFYNYKSINSDSNPPDYIIVGLGGSQVTVACYFCPDEGGGHAVRGLSDRGCWGQAIPLASSHSRGSLASVRGRRVAAA